MFSWQVEENGVEKTKVTANLSFVDTDFRTTSSMNHSAVLRDGRVELGGNFEQSGDPCSFDSTDNFTMAFVGERSAWLSGHVNFQGYIAYEE